MVGKTWKDDLEFSNAHHGLAHSLFLSPSLLDSVFCSLHQPHTHTHTQSTTQTYTNRSTFHVYMCAGTCRSFVSAFFTLSLARKKKKIPAQSRTTCQSCESNFKVRQMQGQHPLNKFPGHQSICPRAKIVAVRISPDPSSAPRYNPSLPIKAADGRLQDTLFTKQ